MTDRIKSNSDSRLEDHTDRVRMDPWDWAMAFRVLSSITLVVNLRGHDLGFEEKKKKKIRRGRENATAMDNLL